MHKNNKVFCMAPWIHLNIEQDKIVRSCCITNGMIYGSLDKNSIEEIWNGDKIKNFRKDLLNGVPRKECKVCYIDEKSCKSSIRNDINDHYYDDYSYLVDETRDDGTVKNPVFVDLDIRFSNKCNFKCRMCDESYSSTWEIEKYGKISGKYDNGTELLKKTTHLLEHAKHLYFAGGEPLIMDEHYYVLYKLVKLGKSRDIRISYNTNFSIIKYKNINVFDIWKKFSNVSLGISVDGTFKKGELIRKGFNWNNFVRNVQEFNNAFPIDSNKRSNFCCTVQALNCFDVMNLHKELYEQSLMRNIDDFYLNFLYTSKEMSIWILDEETKKELVFEIENHIKNFILPNGGVGTVTLFENMINFVNLYQKQNLIPKFIDETKKMDLIRNENTPSIFPELHRIWKMGY